MNEQEQPETITQLAELLARASWRLRRNERKALAPYGLTFAGARALRALVDSGSLRMSELAEALEIVPRTATTRVDGLEQAGLVARSADPNDRRSILVTPTQQGRELVARLVAERRAGAQALFARLGAQDQAELARLLSLLTKDA